MSHAATNWAIKQRGLKPATKIVLWHLCDRHNPDYGCFPKQETLANDCEMSRSTLNRHLSKLEKSGLIRRHQSRDKNTKQQQATRYELAFENGANFTPKDDAEAVSENDTQDAEAVSEKRTIPCPKNGQSRVLNSDSNVVREPVREPVNRASFQDFWNSWPNPTAKLKAEAVWKKLSQSEKDEAAKLAASWFSEWRKRHPDAAAIHPATYLNDRRWEDSQPQCADLQAEKLTFYAEWINGDRPIFGEISSRLIGALIDGGLVKASRVAERLGN